MQQNVPALLLCGCFLPVSDDGVHQLSVPRPQTHRTSQLSTYPTAEELYDPITAVQRHDAHHSLYWNVHYMNHKGLLASCWPV